MARPTTETATFRRFVTAALESGLAISVHDGEEWAVKRSSDKTAIFEAANAVDQCELILRDGEGTKRGWALIVWGNAPDGSELIADYSVTPEMETLVNSLEA